MASLMTLEGPPQLMRPRLGHTSLGATGIGPVDALLDSPWMLLLGVVGGIYLASDRGQKTIAKAKKRFGRR